MPVAQAILIHIKCCKLVVLEYGLGLHFLKILVLSQPHVLKTASDSENSAFYFKTSQGHNCGDITKLLVYYLISDQKLTRDCVKNATKMNTKMPTKLKIPLQIITR